MTDACIVTREALGDAPPTTSPTTATPDTPITIGRRGRPPLDVVVTGKPAPQCFLEAVDDKVPDEVVEEILDGHLPKKEVGKQLKKYLGTPLDVAKAVKCVFIG